MKGDPLPEEYLRQDKQKTGDAEAEDTTAAVELPVCACLEKLAKVNRLGVEEEWEFNEWCHGRTGRPMGYPHQAWSAGMYVFAYRCVRDGRVPDFWESGEG